MVNLITTEGKADWQNLRDSGTAGAVTDVASVGDGAFSADHGVSAGVDFYSGDAFVAVVVVLDGGASPLAQAVDLARTLAGRM